MKNNLLAAILISVCMLSYSQHRHELSVYGGGGLSTFNYATATGKNHYGFGGQGGFGYTLLFTNEIGITTGLGISFHQSKYTLDNFANNYKATDLDGTDFEFRTTVLSYQERQKALFFNIPIALYFQSGEHHKFYMVVGCKLGIPVYAQSVTSESKIKTSGYYTAENKEYTNQKDLGFGTFIQPESKEKLKLNVSAMLTAEIGGKFILNEKISLYAGVYFDYGFNNICKNNPSEMIVDYASANPQITRIWDARYTDDNKKSTAIVERAAPFAFGLKIGIGFGLKDKQKMAPTPETNNSAAAKYQQLQLGIGLSPSRTDVSLVE